MTDQVESIDQRRPVVLVTGGSRGLGNAIAQAFLATGADVVVCGRTSPDETDDRADSPLFLACDVRRPEEVDALISQIIERFGFLDVVVNNAGGSGYNTAGSISPKSFTKVVELNLIAPFIVAQRANEVMQTQAGGGVILNIGSVASLRPPPGTAAYNASKAGLVVLTQSLAIEWAPKVRVNCISPGLIKTEDAAERYTSVEAVSKTIPLGRLVEPHEIAAVCTMLASSQASYVTGANIYVDGGGEIPSFLYALQRHESKDS
jgi:NAD(P)-dependent dehydrogenase (short-subunit alcohol dehydrogenase family)